jgi:hypothetical protein
MASRHLLITVALFHAATAAAQSGNISYGAMTNAPAGSWAEYTMFFNASGDTRKQTYSLVYKTPARAVMEVVTETSAGSGVTQFDYAAGGDAWSLSRGTIRTPNGKTMVVPAMGDNALIKKGAPLGEALGKEAVKTPIGTFECSHWRKKTNMGGADVVMEFWTNDAIFPTGLAKAIIISKGIEVTLAAVGKGAKSKLPGR